MDFLFLAIGLVLGFILAYLILKSKQTTVTNTSAVDSQIHDLEKINLVLNTNFKNLELEKQRLMQELKYEKEQALTNLNFERNKSQDDLNSEKEKLSKAETRIGRAEEIFKSQEEKYNTLKTELENIHKKYSSEFEIIANKILTEKSKTFTDQNKTNLDIILNPLKERIKEFEEKVDKTYQTETKERITLQAEIKNLVQLNKQISDEANNLAKALKGDAKIQGNWGEHILENIFERSGLVKDQEYKKEYSTMNDEGARTRPDFVVLLPDSKHIIVDSKVSLVAYERCVNSDNQDEKEKFLKEHVTSVRKHIKELSERNYQALGIMNTPDFVLLFIPIESSFSLAVQADNELFNFAWDKKIVIVSPSTLLATLRTISSIWKQERQTKNAIEIAKQGGALFDKFVLFLDDMEKIGKSIISTQTAYDSAINKLSTGSGNLVKRAQDIEKLGAKTSKQISTKFTNEEEKKLIED